MKKTIFLLSLILSGLLFTACEKNNNAPTLSFDKDNVEMIVGNTMEVNVRGGISPYKVTCADDAIAKATVKGNVITVNGLKEGKTVLRVACSEGADASLAIVVKTDPFESEKKNATVRVKWDTVTKTDGTDKGVFSLKKANDKTVTISWTNKEKEESLTLSFADKDDVIGTKKITSHNAVNGKSLGKMKLKIGKNSNEYDVTSWRIIQAKPADDKKETPNTFWITFTANGKSGIFVAPLTFEKK